MIRVYRGPGVDVWLVEWFGPMRAEIARLFGEPVLPTAFDSNLPGWIVAQRLQALNPGEQIEVTE